MSKALRSYNIQANLPVGERLSDHQVQNNTGGFVYEVSPKSRLERFLILGVDGGTFYVSENDLTKQNVDWLKGIISDDPQLVLDTILDVSTTGRAYRNSAAIFVLALVLNFGSDSAKKVAADIAPKIARTATHAFELAQYLENLGGWGRAKRTAVANFFTTKTPDQLAYQAVKYRQRNGWTLRDLMRLSHPKGVDQSVGKFVLGNYMGKFSDYDTNMPRIIDGFNAIQKAPSVSSVISILDTFPELPWETIPTEFLKSPEVWKKLFYNGQLKGQALVRNITRLAKMEAFYDSSFRNDIAAHLADPALIKNSRLHPMQYLNASVVYNEGQIDRSYFGYGGAQRNRTWTPNTMILDALKSGFYETFKNVEPSGKSFMIALDVSGSMSWTAAVGTDLTAAQASGAMAMITARVEENSETFGFSNTFKPLNILPTDSFESVMKKITGMNFGSTNASLPMSHALSTNRNVDTFVVITDNEVNTGSHPKATLDKYRKSVNPEAKLAVMAVTPTQFTIADPRDPGMLDVVGFDSDTPKMISDFSKGWK